MGAERDQALILFHCIYFSCLFDELQLIDELMYYDQPADHSYKQLWRVGDSEYEYKFFHGYDYGTDANTTFFVSHIKMLDHVIWCSLNS